MTSAVKGVPPEFTDATCAWPDGAVAVSPTSAAYVVAAIFSSAAVMPDGSASVCLVDRLSNS